MANVTFNVLKIKGVITWLWLMLCLIEILIADTETGGQLMGEQGRKLSTMTGEMSESTRPIIDLKSYIPSRPRRKHRYINIDEEGKVNEDKIAAIDQGINHLDHSRSVFSVPSIEATTRLQNADMNYDDRREEVQTIFMTTEVSDQPYEATSTFNLYDEGKHEKSPVNELTPENVQTYLYNIHRIVEYYKEAAGTEAAKRAKALEMLSNEQQQLLRVSNENRSWRDHFLKLKESHQRLSKAKTSVDFNLALTVGSMRNLLRSPLVAATSVSNNGTSSDESNSSNSLFLKLFPKGLLASAKINGHHSLDAVYQSTLSDELTESFQLSLQDRDIMIHLLSNELEGMQGKFDLWNGEIVTLSQKASEMDEEIFRLTMDIRELKREQETLISKESLQNSTLQRAMEENRALREQVDQQLTTQDRLTSYVDLLRGFVVALTAELDESNQQMKMSSELFSKQSEEFEHLAAQLQNATEQLGALHMMKLSSTSVQVEPPKKKKSRCIFANILCGK